MSQYIIKSIRIRKDSFEAWKAKHTYFSFSRWVQMMLDMENGGREQVIRELDEEFRKIKENELVQELLKHEQKSEAEIKENSEEIKKLVILFKQLRRDALYGADLIKKQQAREKMTEIQKILLEKYGISGKKLEKLMEAL